MDYKKYLSKPVFVWLIAAFCCLLWGSAFPSIKIGYVLFKINSNDTASIILFAGLRFFIAGILNVMIFSIAGKNLLVPRPTSIKKIFVLSVFQTILQYIFFYLGLAYTSGERSSIINATSVFFAILISALIFKLEKFSLHKIIGSAIGFAGVIIVSLDAFKNTGRGIAGEICILISSISYAFSSVFMKRYSKDENPAMLSGYQFMLGGTVMILAGSVFGGRIGYFDAKCFMILMYLAFISAGAYSLWSILLKYNDVSGVAVCGFMTPIFGFILSSLFAKGEENISVTAVLALVLAAAGIVIVNSKKFTVKKY